MTSLWCIMTPWLGTQEFPASNSNEKSFVPCSKKKWPPLPPSFANFVHQPFLLNRPLQYYYRSITRPCLWFWQRSGTGVSLAHATTKPELQVFSQGKKQSQTPHVILHQRQWILWCHNHPINLIGQHPPPSPYGTHLPPKTHHITPSTIYRVGGGGLAGWQISARNIKQAAMAEGEGGGGGAMGVRWTRQ